MVLTPAATAEEDSWPSKPVCARWRASSEEEQAVSVDTQGPPSPNVYDTLCRGQYPDSSSVQILLFNENCMYKRKEYHTYIIYISNIKHINLYCKLKWHIFYI